MRNKRDNRAWLQDMLASIEAIESYTTQLNVEAFMATPQIQHAVLFNVQIIGEAANRLDTTLRQAHDVVPWAQIIGMRHIVVHGYFAVNLQIIWRTITEELPPLKKQILMILDSLDQS